MKSKYYKKLPKMTRNMIRDMVINDHIYEILVNIVGYLFSVGLMVVPTDGTVGVIALITCMVQTVSINDAMFKQSEILSKRKLNILMRAKAKRKKEIISQIDLTNYKHY